MATFTSPGPHLAHARARVPTGSETLACRVRSRETLLALLLLLLVLSACSADSFGQAEPEFDQGPVLSFTEENDFVNGTDRWYTQGAKIAYLQGDNHVPRWTDRLFDHVPALGFSIGAQRFGYELGQSMFTPADTRATQVLEDDRPYAGWLYTGLIVQRRGVGAGGFLTLENFQLDLGIIGPESFAHEVQTWFHTHTPPGWPNQLSNEPGVALKYGRAWLIPLPSWEQRYVDLVPQGGLSLGNVDTSFRIGTTLRAGWNLPEDFGIQPIESLFTTEGGRSPSRSGQRWGFYVFSGVEGRAVLYTAFLDGNAFCDSPSVDKEPFVGEWHSGLVLVLDRVELAYTEIFRTRDFVDQPEGQVYGSFCVKVKF
jgi:lipid A 3-O-deacylase